MKISTVIKKAKTLHGIDITMSKAFSKYLISKNDLYSLIRYTLVVGFSEGYDAGKLISKPKRKQK